MPVLLVTGGIPQAPAWLQKAERAIRQSRNMPGCVITWGRSLAMHMPLLQRHRRRVLLCVAVCTCVCVRGCLLCNVLSHSVMLPT